MRKGSDDVCSGSVQDLSLIHIFKEILKGYNVISLKDAGIDLDVEENGTTFEEKDVYKRQVISCDKLR